jgi:predicted CXXCH cytochrome family protein
MRNGWVHGPVAAGQCVLCHEPHRSRYPFLLKKDVPELCMQCHQSLDSVENHARPNYAACLDCHWGHTSVAKHLLKAGSLASETRAGASEPTGDAEFDQILALARNELQGQINLDEAWNNVAAYTRQGEVKKARAYLMAIRMDPSLSSTAKEQWSALQETLEASEQIQVRQARQIEQEQARMMAQLYYQSVNALRDGNYVEAQAGFNELLSSDVVPDVIKQAIRGYLEQIQQQTGQGEAIR